MRDLTWTWTLTADEVAVAFLVAGIRNEKNGGQSNLPGGETATVEERLRQHRAACVAEIAVSRLTNLCWTGCGKGSEGMPDVGGVLEVRSIRDRGLSLLVRAKDDWRRPYVLVWVEPQPVQGTILGWRVGQAVVDEGIARDRGTTHPYWTLPESQCWPPESLLEWVMDSWSPRERSG